MAPHTSGCVDVLCAYHHVLMTVTHVVAALPHVPHLADHQLEAAQGCIDEEARQGLELLRAKTKELEVAQVAVSHHQPLSSSTPAHRHAVQILTHSRWRLYQTLSMIKLKSTSLAMSNAVV